MIYYFINIYLGQEKWQYIDSKLYSYLTSVANTDREVILTGDSKLVTTWINIFRLFNIKVSIDYTYVLFE